MKKTQPKDLLGIDIRKEILFISLHVEGMTSAYLASLLGIKDYRDSSSLGNKSGGLSFNQKVDLLIDIGALSKEKKKKFQTFMEIRNKFMHCIEATTYEKCLALIDKKAIYLLTTYPQADNLSQEEKLKAATMGLGNDIVKLTVELQDRIKDKIRKEVETDIYKKSHQAFKDSINQLKTTMNDYFDNEIEKSPTYNTKRLKNSGTAVSKTLWELWKKNFDLLN